MLRLAASLEQASAHVTAASIVEAAHDRGLHLSFPQKVRETAGEGLTGEVEGQEVVVGGHDFVARQIGAALERPAHPPGTALAALAVSGRFAGHLLLADAVRAETPAALAQPAGGRHPPHRAGLGRCAGSGGPGGAAASASTS